MKNNKTKSKIIFLAIIFFCLFGFAQNSEAKVINVVNTSGQPSCEAVDVQRVINDANTISGDTIFIPEATCTWKSDGISCSASNVPCVNVNKAITIMGAGVGKTVIIDQTGLLSNQAPINITSDSVRISHIEFGGPQTIGETRGAILISDPGDTNIRIDHNKITVDCATGRGVTIRTTDYHSIVIDHNTFLGTVSSGVQGVALDPSAADADAMWLQSFGQGDVVFIEDNYFSTPYQADGGVELYNGGRATVRNNTFLGWDVGTHGADSSNRSGRYMEIYNNTFDGYYTGNGKMAAKAIHSRGGAYTVFNNIIINYANPMSLMYYRACYGVTGCSGTGTLHVNNQSRCDGNASIDGNASGMQGYPCKDQNGVGGGAPGSQTLSPLYEWNNCKTVGCLSGDANDVSFVVPTGRPFGAGCEQNCVDPSMADHIKENRDYYNTVASFNGTTGVGVGTIASRPATCTTGVAYWATDEGEWDSTHTGSDGRLYRCTATDTWTLAYTPYTYPHPLTLGDDTTPPLAPTGVVIE